MKITFTQNLPLGAQLGFDLYNSGASGSLPSTTTYVWNWVAVRTANFQVRQIQNENPNIQPGSMSMINFVNALQADCPGQFIIQASNSNYVTIIAENVTSRRQFFVGGILAPYVNHPSIQFEILNDTGDIFNIQSYSFLQADSNQCEKIKISLQTSELAKKMTSPISITNNNDNPLVFEYFRGQSFPITLEDVFGNIASVTVDTPGLLSLNPDVFQILIVNSPNGSTVTFLMQAPDSLVIEYSLDDINWQAENIFSGLLEGDYTVYVRDQYGCKKSKDFHVDSMGINSPFFYISKSMSLRFANRVVWGDSGNYKNDENTLSYETLVKEKFCEVQQFQSSDLVTTQFFSNYLNLAATVIENDGNETSIPIVKKTNNIGLKDSRDARLYSLGGGKNGMYFIQGNTYDYDSGSTLSNYVLNGALPEWAEVGKFFAIGMAWFQIEEIVYDENKNADIIVFTNSFTGSDSDIIAKAIYNRFEYEVYEFTIDMVAFLNKSIRVKLENTDPNFPAVEYISENIDVKVRQEDTVEIRYKNLTNTDVVYATGIENILRIPFTVINGLLDEENDTYKTDTTVKLLKSELYEVDEFVFEPLTKELWRKLCQALSHEIVFIDGVGYTKNSDFDTEGPLGESNLYVLKAKMIKNGNVYNSSGLIDSGFGASPIEVPGFVESDNDGFVRY